MPDLRAGVYRHWKGHLYQALASVTLSEWAPSGGMTPLFSALDASEGADNRRLAVGLRGDAVFAHPVDMESPMGASGLPVRAAVLYIGLALDGATPGPRLRVRDLYDFTVPVRWPDNSYRPRFEFLGEEWRP